MSTALLENSIVAGRNKIRTSPLDHRTVSISRLLFAYCANHRQISIQRHLALTWERPIWNQNKTTRVAEERELKASTAQLDNSNALSPNKIELHDHSSSILFYNQSSQRVNFSATCLLYRREVSFTIHHKFLLVYITLFQLSALYSVVYPVCKSKANFAHRFSSPCIDSNGSDDALRRNVNRNVRTVFCIIEIAEVVSSLAELE